MATMPKQPHPQLSLEEQLEYAQANLEAAQRAYHAALAAVEQARGVVKPDLEHEREEAIASVSSLNAGTGVRQATPFSMLK